MICWIVRKALKCLWASSKSSLLEVCNRSSCASIRQPAEFLTGHALQIACRERGAVGICARSYAPQKIFTFEDQRATYVRGDAPSVAGSLVDWRSCLTHRNFPETAKDGEALPKILEGATIYIEKISVHIFGSLSDSVRRLFSFLCQLGWWCRIWTQFMLNKGH